MHSKISLQRRGTEPNLHQQQQKQCAKNMAVAGHIRYGNSMTAGVIAIESPPLRFCSRSNASPRSTVLFDHCAECKRCCTIDDGHPPLEVSLTRVEKKKLGRVCIERNCQHLGDQGCTMGEDKPFACSLYPLSFDPVRRQFLYDSDCPLMPTYIKQLKRPESDAQVHFSMVQNAIFKLEKKDPSFLQQNFTIDVDYFDLKKLPHPPLPKESRK
jgi:Fe-S-cluster containining protein